MREIAAPSSPLKPTTLCLLALLMAFSFLIRRPFLNVPLERDEGVRATIAQGMLEGAGLPYRDFYTNKPPIVLFVYLFIFKTFGHSVRAIHQFVQLYALLGIILIFALVRRAGQGDAAALARRSFSASRRFHPMCRARPRTWKS